MRYRWIQVRILEDLLILFLMDTQPKQTQIVFGRLKIMPSIPTQQMVHIAQLMVVLLQTTYWEREQMPLEVEQLPR